MAYWGEVAQRAWRETRKVTKTETIEAIVVLFAGQAVLAVALWYSTGDAELWTRIATASLPFLLTVPVYAFKFVAAPQHLNAEAVQKAETLRAEIISLKAAVEGLNTELSVLKAPPLRPARNPDGIYQRGAIVGTARAADKRLGLGVVRFGLLEVNGDFSERNPFEYHDLKLLFERCAGSARQGSMGVITSQRFMHAECRVVGHT